VRTIATFIANWRTRRISVYGVPSMQNHTAKTQPQPSRLAPAAWVLYDLANTVYAATVTFLFTPFFEARFGALQGLGLTQTASLTLAALLVPICGAIVDRTARTGLYLSLATLVCIGAMAGLGVFDQEPAILACFFIANVAYNLGLLFYNSLLTSVAPPHRAGFWSGIGVGIGYVGTILVLVTLLPMEQGPHQFQWAAAMFFVFALPCMAFVRDRRPLPTAIGANAIGDAMRSLRTTLRELPKHRPLFWFLLANFCLVDVLNTAVMFFASFTGNVFLQASKEGGFSMLGVRYEGASGLQDYIALCGLCLNGCALLFGIGLGALTDRRPLLVMRASSIALLLALCGGSWFGGASPLGYMLSLGVLGSLGLAGIWTAGRKVVVLLSPPDRIGEHFGLYGITVKLSVVGSTVYARVADAYGSKPAMLSQAVPLVLGLCLLALVRLPKSGDAVRPA
jgi:UMF1 family MFS transporter